MAELKKLTSADLCGLPSELRCAVKDAVDRHHNPNAFPLKVHDDLVGACLVQFGLDFTLAEVLAHLSDLGFEPVASLGRLQRLAALNEHGNGPGFDTWSLPPSARALWCPAPSADGATDCLVYRIEQLIDQGDEFGPPRLERETLRQSGELELFPTHAFFVVEGAPRTRTQPRPTGSFTAELIKHVCGTPALARSVQDLIQWHRRPPPGPSLEDFGGGGLRLVTLPIRFTPLELERYLRTHKLVGLTPHELAALAHERNGQTEELRHRLLDTVSSSTPILGGVGTPFLEPDGGVSMTTYETRRRAGGLRARLSKVSLECVEDERRFPANTTCFVRALLPT